MATNGSSGAGPTPPPPYPPPPFPPPPSYGGVSTMAVAAGFNPQTHTILGSQAAPPMAQQPSALAPNAPQALAPYAVPGYNPCGCGCGCNCACGCGGQSTLYANGQPYYPTATSVANPTHAVSGGSVFNPNTPVALAPYAGSGRSGCECNSGRITGTVIPNGIPAIDVNHCGCGCGCSCGCKTGYPRTAVKRLKPLIPSVAQWRKSFLKPTIPGTQIVAQPYPQFNRNVGKASGIIPASVRADLPAGAQTGLDSPGCHIVQSFSYFQGPLLTNVEVIPVFWGTQWDSKSPNGDATHIDIRNRMPDFFKWFLGSQIMDILIQDYSTAQQQIQYGSLTPNESYLISENSDFNQTVTQSTIESRLQSWINDVVIPPVTNGQQLYMIYLPDGVMSSLPSFPNPLLSCDFWCGYHSSFFNRGTQIFYGVIIYPSLTNCLNCFQDLARNVFDSITELTSHEVCEAITDPGPGTGWMDPNLTNSGLIWEIGDSCQCSNITSPSGVILNGENGNSYLVQKIWSQLPGATTGSCAFEPEKVVPNTSVVNCPAIAGIGDEIVLAWHSPSDERLHVTNNLEWGGMNFETPVEVTNETAIDAPAISVGPGDKYYLAWTGRDTPNHINIRSTFDVSNWDGSSKVVLDEWSYNGPALAYGNGTLFLAFTGTNGHIYLRWSFDGNWYDYNKIELQQWAIDSPGIFYSYPYLYLSFRGTNNDQIYVCRTKDYGQTLELLHTIPNQATDYTPNLTLTNGELILAWRGTDSAHTINTMRGDLNTMTFGRQEVYDQTASGSVTIATFQGATYIGWSGNDADHRLNIMELP